MIQPVIPRGYVPVGDWSWEFYPPPYDFLAPRGGASQPAPVIPYGGLSGCHCGGTCGGCGGHGGGLGLFDAGLDLSQWTFTDWLVAGLGSYLVLKLARDVQKVGGKARSRYRRAQSTNRRKAELQRELASLR